MVFKQHRRFYKNLLMFSWRWPEHKSGPRDTHEVLDHHLQVVRKTSKGVIFSGVILIVVPFSIIILHVLTRELNDFSPLAVLLIMVILSGGFSLLAGICGHRVEEEKIKRTFVTYALLGVFSTVAIAAAIYSLIYALQRYSVRTVGPLIVCVIGGITLLPNAIVASQNLKACIGLLQARRKLMERAQDTGSLVEYIDKKNDSKQDEDV